ncbi:hypothetical protein BKM16_22735 [Pseudomonas amygdali pv. morsprunorum]|nr:hypothetical protein BKM22_22775 [Pseudomonas amygdali pv. morsprunorum]POD40829.1 hypothetical protein BKM16_22735 [Pseudomonas amygdali pv. morsprunorum]POD43369.1 hypothetical protein BKM02_22750 [Pseudomonas amygdali pv. morsprunorum]
MMINGGAPHYKSLNPNATLTSIKSIYNNKIIGIFTRSLESINAKLEAKKALLYHFTMSDIASRLKMIEAW